jgi:magnesium transporter
VTEDIFKHIKKEIRAQVPKVTKEKTISEVIEILKKESKLCESIDYIYVVEKDDNLIGVFSIKDLFRLPKKTKVENFMSKEVIHISPSADYKLILRLALRHEIKALPVVKDNKLIGVIPPKEITQIINKTLRAESFSFAGIHKSHLDYKNTEQIPMYKSITHRMPWLIIGLIGIMTTATFLGSFEGILKKYLILTFFIPTIVYVSGALANQIQTIFTRDLAVTGDKLNIKKYLLKQGTINLFISLIMSILVFIIITLFWNQKYLALVISISSLSALIITSIFSFVITLSIEKFGGDPALGAGPFATVVSDTTSIIIYFAVATAML